MEISRILCGWNCTATLPTNAAVPPIWKKTFNWFACLPVCVPTQPTCLPPLAILYVTHSPRVVNCCGEGVYVCLCVCLSSQCPLLFAFYFSIQPVRRIAAANQPHGLSLCLRQSNTSDKSGLSRPCLLYRVVKLQTLGRNTWSLSRPTPTTQTATLHSH